MCSQKTELSPAPKKSSPETKPKSESQLRKWIKDYTGIYIPDQRVCPDHQSPWECFKTVHLERPSVALVLGSRGSGKSFLSALDTHLTSRFNPSHGTRILGGSKAQSEQIYRALREIATQRSGSKGSDADVFERLRRDGATYANGSEVAILAASSTSVRGPHVPSLKLDEVDEIDTDLRESAMGMCMSIVAGRGRSKAEALRASVLMTSTCHRMNGPMAKLIEKAKDGEFPLFTMCVFEVLERCPTERSGPANELCSECPLKPHCHDVSDGGPPKAKRSDGHYPIDSLIQKLRTTGTRTFEADYLCKLSGSESAWFPRFKPEQIVTTDAEYRPREPVHIAVDSGVYTGAVFFQVIKRQEEGETHHVIHVFGDYLAENRSAETNARAIVELSNSICQGRRDYGSTDPAGGARTSIGPTVLGEYQRAGLVLQPWPLVKVPESLAFLSSFLDPATGPPQLFIHPRCTAMIQALHNYRRAKKAGQHHEFPADPQHPYEDLVDALRGGLKAAFPFGRNYQPNYKKVPMKHAV